MSNNLRDDNTFSGKLRKTLLIVSGTICVGLGIIGIFLPLLPSTPFFLLAAFCYLRSSQKLYEKLIKNRFVGEKIRLYMEHRVVHTKYKIYALILMWATLVLSIILLKSWIIAVILAVTSSLVSLYILSLKSKIKDSGTQASTVVKDGHKAFDK